MSKQPRFEYGLEWLARELHIDFSRHSPLPESVVEGTLAAFPEGWQEFMLRVYRSGYSENAFANLVLDRARDSSQPDELRRAAFGILLAFTYLDRDGAEDYPGFIDGLEQLAGLELFSEHADLVGIVLDHGRLTAADKDRIRALSRGRVPRRPSRARTLDVSAPTTTRGEALGPIVVALSEGEDGGLRLDNKPLHVREHGRPTPLRIAGMKVHRFGLALIDLARTGMTRLTPVDVRKFNSWLVRDGVKNVRLQGEKKDGRSPVEVRLASTRDGRPVRIVPGEDFDPAI